MSHPISWQFYHHCTSVEQPAQNDIARFSGGVTFKHLFDGCWLLEVDIVFIIQPSQNFFQICKQYSLYMLSMLSTALNHSNKIFLVYIP
jgi:hypothetical protein